jgi:hypothetical protein
VTRRHVLGHCPACGRETLALNPSGRIVCCAENCSNPDALSRILADPNVGHVVDIRERAISVRHPRVESLDVDEFACQLGDFIARADRPPVGVYRVEADYATGIPQLNYAPLLPTPTASREDTDS